MNKTIKNTIKIFTILLLAIAMLALTACSTKEGETKHLLDAFEASDMSGYEGLSDYSGPLPFVDVTVKDIQKLMEDKESFVLFVSFPKCPWCNAVIEQFTEVAAEESSGSKGSSVGKKIACLNTRKNPEWESNLEIDDYDVFVELFGDYLEYDSNNIKHLYVPHVFFIKDGEVVYEHQGAIPAMGSDPYMELTKEQNEELKNVYREGFAKMK